MNFKNIVLQYKRNVDDHLEALLSEDDSLLHEIIRYAVLGGGKRYRPLLALFSGENFGVDKRVVLPFACAVELIHNYSLIHDDLPCMDNDDFRRGKPSCHKAYGEDLALLAGDALLTMAFRVLAQAPLKGELSKQKEQIIADVSQAAGIDGMIGGQLLDVTLVPEEISDEKMNELMLKKTAALITASVRIGALLGKASSSELKAITEYGKNVGLAFQTRDDLLDSSQDVKKGRQLNPNSVSHFGLEKTEYRLKDFIRKALEALDRNHIDSSELRHMAQMLSEVKGG
jgi:geranylgeranyl diphosphate synthase type II